jgi:hypothetical protein
MKKILAGTLALALMSTAAHADYRGHGYRGGGGGNWVAPLVGGLVVGGIVGGALAAPRYYEVPPTHTECQWVPVYDRYGVYRGDRRECYQVPNY